MQLPWTWWWDLPNQLHDCHLHCRHPGNEWFGPEGRTKGLEQKNQRKWIITSREFMCNFDPHRPWLSFSSLVNSSMSTCVQIENIFCREINLTCLGVNVVVAGEKVGQTHYEESKTEDLCYLHGKTLPEAQRTQGIEFKTWVISLACNNKNSIQSKR